MQTTSHLLMIRPVQFGFNAQTAVNNAFQVNAENAGTQQRAVAEFDAFVALLRANGVDVTVIDDTPEPHTPDSIFPNNWVSFHNDGNMILYPMFAENRRLERKQHVLDTIRERFRINNIVDLSHFEQQAVYLEGTGSMVLDRDNRLAYACVSVRTDIRVLARFCEELKYSPVIFHANDMSGRPIYHTNVMMCIADRYAVICLESIPAGTARDQVEKTILGSGKEIIEITQGQMNEFAGNMLQVNNDKGEKLLVMSTRAWEALSREQQARLSAFDRVVHSPLTTIETNGGGSARCMMAEIHLPGL